MQRTPLHNVSFGSTLNRLILADGTVALLRSGIADLSVFVDINGAKEPNTLGRDIFRFNYNKDGKIFFNRYGQSPSDESDNSWASCNPTRGEGWACVEWVYFKENMDYLHCADELDWNTKTRSG
ncbi:hypothetical protein IJ732_06585 [bacterium]|nr:hypothetical protein [bacterium]